MKAVIENNGATCRVHFVEGPRAGRHASVDIGLPTERPREWPDAESARAWMQWEGHKEHVFDAMEYLQERSTRELLAIRDSCHKFNGAYDITENSGNAVVTHDQVKAVLATREHIPNKTETKARRQALAMVQRHR